MIASKRFTSRKEFTDFIGDSQSQFLVFSLIEPFNSEVMILPKNGFLAKIKLKNQVYWLNICMLR
jgi:hypothetical protein